MNKAQITALYDQDQRKDVEYPDMRREVTPNVVRHINTSDTGDGEGMIIYSQLNEANADDKHHQVERKPVWERFEKGHKPDPELCRQEEHTWVAFFFESGRLAYWECEGCSKTDREIEQLPERLEWLSGWVKHPPRLVTRGPNPPISTRKWATADGAILMEGGPSSIHFEGVEIPGLAEAHTYIKYIKNEQVEQIYEPSQEKPGQYVEHYWLTRYQVIDTALVRFESHCYEESTFDTPYADEPKQEIVLSGLRLLSD